jgi:hypothetical protein
LILQSKLASVIVALFAFASVDPDRDGGADVSDRDPAAEYRALIEEIASPDQSASDLPAGLHHLVVIADRNR